MTGLSTPAGSRPRILELADRISHSAAQLDTVLRAKSIPSPSFAEDAPAPYPSETDDVRDDIIDAAAELYDLLLEPMALLYKKTGVSPRRPMTAGFLFFLATNDHQHNNMVCLQFITRFGVADMVPAGGRASFDDIAAQIPGLTESIVRRLLRHAMTMRVFHEPEPGMVAHTKASKALQANPVLNAWLRNGTHEMWPAAVKMLDALERWPGSSEPSETGFALANDTVASAFEILGSDPARAARFGRAMSIYAMKPEYSPSYLTEYYDWAALESGRVLAVAGGSYFQVAVELARRFPNLQISLQDTAQSLPGPADGAVPSDVQERLHVAVVEDTFAPQIPGAQPVDIVLLRWVLHIWPDKYCVRLLRAQIPLMRPGTKLVIQDVIFPKPGTIAQWREQDLRASDIHMANLFNGQERTAEEWEALIAHADSRFVVSRVVEPKGSALGIIEVCWRE
ncbi:S-adenosyl-L-methionine-dependent methyltransferase [Cercophora samala]|uniref:S-adenosyl-L-methionine-dependent methyltransferase n=1 Tax=Cercophora samala TaxID=330535 RepID=A0AA40DA79_9PEZI|nr:S-adenosyl-L-methionine-dependent methyltransferase [Cercophora samala]